MTTEKAVYATSVTVQGGRAGTATSDDGHLALNLSVPKAFGGAGGEGTNPEQLFAAGYAACFQSAVEFAGRRQRVDASNSTIIATVGLFPDGSGGFKLGVKMAV